MPRPSLLSKLAVARSPAHVSHFTAERAGGHDSMLQRVLLIHWEAADMDYDGQKVLEQPYLG